MALEITINGESMYGPGGRTDLEVLAGRRVAVRLLDGSEATGKLAGFWPTGLELDFGRPAGARYYYFRDVASVRPAA